MLNQFLEENYDGIVKMAEKITQDSNYREIAHFVIEAFMEHHRAYELVEEGNAMKFLSGMIHRNYHSSSSPYHKIYRQKGRVFAKENVFRNTHVNDDTYDSFDSGYLGYRSPKGHKTQKEKIQEEAVEGYDYETDLRLDAIEGILEDMLADEQHIWYIASLFTMWIETPNYSELERRTHIPRTSISQAVNEAKEYIQQKMIENGIDC